MATLTILRLPQVLSKTGISRSGLYQKISQGLMPEPVHLGARAVGWPAHEIDLTLRARLAGQQDAEVRQLIARLHASRKVRRTGPGRWLARCPAHDDRGPSLSIRELDDERVLLHCFAGCEAPAVLAAVGLEMSELFPPRETQQGKPERRPFPATDVLRAVSFEAMVVLTSASAMLAGKFTTADRSRLATAVNRIQAALDVAGVSYD